MTYNQTEIGTENKEDIKIEKQSERELEITGRQTEKKTINR